MKKSDWIQVIPEDDDIEFSDAYRQPRMGCLVILIVIASFALWGWLINLAIN